MSGSQNNIFNSVDFLNILMHAESAALDCRAAQEHFENVETNLCDLNVPTFSKTPPFIQNRQVGFEMVHDRNFRETAIRLNCLCATTDKLIADIFKLAWVLDEAVAEEANLKQPDEARPHVQKLYTYLSATRPELLDRVPEPCGPDNARENVHYLYPVDRDLNSEDEG